MNNQKNDTFKQYIAERLKITRELAREKREAGVTEQDVRELFRDDVKKNIPDIVDVKVEVPLIKNGRPFFNLRKSFVEKALREGKLMRLTWPDGSALHKPEEWLKGEPYQKEFKFAGKPMEMVGNYLERE